jgi:hypothetical protein
LVNRSIRLSIAILLATGGRLVHDASLRRRDGNGKTRCTISSRGFSILIGAIVSTADLHEIAIDRHRARCHRHQ